jgi:hypothetical protein
VRRARELLLTIPTSLTKVWNDKKGETEKESEKAEILTILSETRGKAAVLVLFDNVDDGRPARYEVTLPSTTSVDEARGCQELRHAAVMAVADPASVKPSV